MKRVEMLVHLQNAHVPAQVVEVIAAHKLAPQVVGGHRC